MSDDLNPLLALAVGTLVSEDLACISAGLLVASGRLDFVSATAATLLGIYVGDLLLFLAGRVAPTKRLRTRWAEPVRRGTEWFDRHGASAVFFARFVPGMRLPTYVAAGALGTSFTRFSIYFLAAAIVWTPLLVGSVAYFGQRVGVAGRVAAAVVVFALLRGMAILASGRSRRLFVSRWKRMTRWEFWPAWLAYLPVVPYLLWLAIRHRGLTFTAANPAIPASGVVGESKLAILQLLDPEYVPPTRLVRSPDDVLALPAVLKPDAGQRGSGVVVARTMDDVRAYFERFDGPTLCQEYVDGPELGLFYVRYPGERRGRIISVTDKRLPSVTGDGRSTLETLILNDPRAVCMARFYLRKLAARLHEIPAAGEAVRLVELGTHCRGAVFLDGRALLTPELEETIDRISRNARGFYFGRYDVRIRDGRPYVLELNGVTSEATHIYDPDVGIVDAYRALFAQWRMAFEIGAINRQRGAATTGIRELVQQWRAYRRIAASHP